MLNLNENAVYDMADGSITIFIKGIYIKTVKQILGHE